jgi:hypothetical protein
MTAKFNRAALAVAAVTVLSMPAATAQAQSAEQYNRATQAIQICGSAMGAMVPECAKFRGGLGMSVVTPQQSASALGSLGLGGGGLGSGGGKAAGIASLLGQAVNAARSQQQAAAPQAPVANPSAIQQAITTCVQNAGGNSGAIQACLQVANAAPQAAGGYAPPASNPFGALLPKR